MISYINISSTIIAVLAILSVLIGFTINIFNPTDYRAKIYVKIGFLLLLLFFANLLISLLIKQI